MRLIIFILFTFLQLNLFSQVPVTYSFSEQQGFSPRTIYNMYEDVNRNMWFGTNDGLYKWDGNEFLRYQNPNYSNSYSSIQQDKTGRIWCLNFTGQLFFIENDSLKLFVDEKKKIHSTFDYNLSDYPTIYLTSNYGLIEYEFISESRKEHKGDTIVSNRNLAVINNTDTLFPDLIEQLPSYKNGMLYWSRGDMIYKEKDRLLEKIVRTPIKSIFATPYIFPREDKVLVVFNEGLKKRTSSIIEVLENGEAHKVALNFKNEINPSSIFYDDEKKIFLLGSKNGMVVLDQHYQSIFQEKTLEGKNISGFIKDHEGNYWVSTLNDGVYIFPSFELIKYNNEKFQNKNVSFLLKDINNSIYFIEDFGGIYKLNKTNNIEYIGSFHQRVEHVIYNPYRNEIYTGNLRSSFNLNTNRLGNSIYGRNFKSISFLDATTILVSSSTNANLRTASKENTNYLDLFNSQSFQYNPNEKFNQSVIRKKRSNHNAFDFVNETAYISYADGFYYYNKGKEQELFYDDKSILISTISKVNNEFLWVTTINGVLLQLKKGQVVNDFDINIKAKEILSWKDYLFISNNSGILKLNTKTQKQNWINTIDGLPSNDILDMEIVNDSLFVATTKGVIRLDCHYDYVNKKVPLVKITNITIWEKDTILRSSYFLDYNQNNITFYFGANATRSRKKYTYQYRMLGVDSAWIIQKSENNFVRFPSLSSDNYTFQIKSINEDGVESNIEEVQLMIDAPYYQKGWFYMLIGLFIVFIVSLIFIIRIRIIQKQNTILQDKKEIEKQLSQSQLTALRSQMNPHFVFNALNSIQDYIISNNKELASDYLGLFADLMRKYLNFSNEDEITLEEEIETLEMYLKLEKVRFEETLEYSINVTDEVDTFATEIPVMLIQPFAENAIKHGLLHKKGKRILVIEFKKENQNLVISIKDNGIGRKQSAEVNKMRNKEHKSFATSAQQKRVKLINEGNKFPISIKYIDLYNENKEAEGTLVKIVIPLV